MVRKSRYFSIIACAILACAASMQVSAQQMWLAGNDPVVSAMIHRDGQADYMDMFAPGAPWKLAEQHTNVFMVSTQFIDHATDDQLSTIINGLRQRNISLGMAGLMLVPTQRCGRGVESYGRAHVMDRVGRRLLRLGGRLDFVAFDEPVWFAHRAVGPTTCQDSLTNLAAQMIEPATALKSAFPRLSFVDTEPLNSHTDASFLADVIAFVSEFRRATSYSIDAIHADIIWRDDWQGQYRSWQRRTRETGLRFGVICRGSAVDNSDEGWTSNALQNIHDAVSEGRTRPDDIVVQTWGMRPTRMMPDSDPGALTWIVRQAFAR